jgi:hypothetical protein
LRIVTNVSAGCDGRFRCERRTQRERTAKSWRPDISMPISNWRQCLRIALVTVAESPITGETTKETVKTTARGMPECFG